MESRAGGPPVAPSATRKSQLNRSLSNSDVAGYEKNDGSISDSAVSSSVTEGRKRRPSLGYKVAALVGLSRKSNSTSQLAGQGESDCIDGNEIEAYHGHMTYDVRGHGGQSSPYGRERRADQGKRSPSGSYNGRLRSEGGLARGRGRTDMQYNDSSRNREGRQYDIAYPQSNQGRPLDRGRRGRSADRAELYLQGQARHGRDGRPGILRQNSADSGTTSGYGSMHAPEDLSQRPASAQGSYGMGQGQGSYQGHGQIRPHSIGRAQGQGQPQQMTSAGQGQSGYYDNQGNYYSQDQYQGHIQGQGHAGYGVQGQIQGQNGQAGAYSNQGQFQGQGHSMAYPNQAQTAPQPNQTQAVIHAQPNQMAAQTPTGVIKKQGGNIIMPLATTPTKRAPLVISPAAVDQNSLFATLGPRPASATPTTPSKSSSFGRLSEMVSSPSALFSKAKESSDGQSTDTGSTNIVEMGTGLLNKGLASFKSFF